MHFADGIQGDAAQKSVGGHSNSRETGEIKEMDKYQLSRESHNRARLVTIFLSSIVGFFGTHRSFHYGLGANAFFSSF